MNLYHLRRRFLIKNRSKNANQRRLLMKSMLNVIDICYIVIKARTKIKPIKMITINRIMNDTKETNITEKRKCETKGQNMTIWLTVTMINIRNKIIVRESPNTPYTKKTHASTNKVLFITQMNHLEVTTCITQSITQIKWINEVTGKEVEVKSTLLKNWPYINARITIKKRSTTWWKKWKIKALKTLL